MGLLKQISLLFFRRIINLKVINDFVLCFKVIENLERKVSLQKSLIIFGPNNITVYEGETVQLHCLTQPGSIIQWSHNNELINFNLMRQYEMLSSGGLRIVSAQKTDWGIYTCIASKVGFNTDTAECFVHIKSLRLNTPGKFNVSFQLDIIEKVFLVFKLEISDIEQIDNYSIKLFWKIKEDIEKSLNSIQIQYRLIHSNTSWVKINHFYNHSINYTVIDNLQSNRTYKFRLIGFDINGQQLVIGDVKQYLLKLIANQLDLPSIKITDAWITNDGRIRLKWKVSKNYF